MTTVIKTKNSTTTTTAPSSLAQGELAVNITDKKLWVGNAAGTPVQLINGGSDGVFTSVTDSGLTAGRVVYTSTGGLLASSANLLYSGTDLTVYGITVGRGAGSYALNTAVGTNALGSNTANAGATAIGYQAMALATSSSASVALGYYALYNTTTGGYNTAIGTQALQANTTADNNTALGYQSAYNNTTGTSLTAVGRRALYSNTTGGDNSAIGINALYFNTTGASNTALGAAALQSNTTASYSTAVGYQAGLNNNADFNTFIGRLAGGQSAGITGQNNTGVGNAALGQVTSGSQNTAIGTTALQNTTTGANNAAVGFQALSLNSTGNYNSALGWGALYSNTTASNNTAVGYQAAYSNTTGVRNSAFGQVALYTNSTGQDNAAIAQGALYSNTTGSYNTAVGKDALVYNTTASNNTAVGYQAGYSNSVGTLNAFFGYAAGYNCTGSYNTFIGRDAGGQITSGTKNTILGPYNGNQGGLNITTASNYIVLSDGDGNPRGYFDGSGNFCINNATASGLLNVKGGGNNTYLTQTTGSGYVLQTDATVNGSTYYFVNFLKSGTGISNITSNGTTISYNTGSDYRLKQNIQPIANALETVSKLKPSTWDWKEFWGTGGSIGFVAHELAEVIPECVTGEKDAVDADGNPKYQGVDTSFLIATLTAAIQELKAEFDAYKATHP